MSILRKVSPCASFSTTGWGRASCTFSFWFFHVGCGWLRGLLQTHQARDHAKTSRSVFGAAKLFGRSLRALGKIVIGLSALVGCVLHPCFCLCWSVSVLVCNIVCRVWVKTCGQTQRWMCTKLARVQSVLSLEESRAVTCWLSCFTLFTQVLLRKHHRYELCFFLSCVVK
jgi:hypothetical protein